MRIWSQTMLPPVITISLYFVIFGNLVGSRIGEMGGFRYMEFIVPGLIMMAVIQNSYSNVVSSFFSQKFQRSVEELLVAPIPNYIILSGFVAGGMARGLCVGLIVDAGFPAVRGTAVVQPADHDCRCGVHLAGFLPGRIHQRGVRQQLRRHIHHTDVRADPADLSRRRVSIRSSCCRHSGNWFPS